MKTFQSREGVTLRWQNLLHNPKCVNSLRISLSDGEHVKDLERSGQTLQQKKIEIPYSHTKCRTHPLSLTVNMESNSGTCFVASTEVTYKLRLNETQRQECLRQVRIKKEAEESERQREIEEKIKLLEKEMHKVNYNKTEMHQENYNEERNNKTEKIQENHIPRTFRSLPNITIPTRSPKASKLKSSQNTIDGSTVEGVGDDTEADLDNSLIVIGGISFTGGLLVMLVLLGIGYMVRRRRRRGKFNVQQGVDLNFTYGTYSNYYSDYNTVEDTNPYYSSHL